MNLNWCEVFLKNALLQTTVIQVLNGLQSRTVKLLDFFALGQILSTLNVFTHDQTDELFIALMVVIRKFNQTSQCILGL